jgi:hypothetical protein
MLPTFDKTHVAEALALLTGQFSSDVNTPNVRNLVRIAGNRTQDVENTLWDVINSQLLAKGPTGAALDQIADLVGSPGRGSFTDAQLLLWVLVTVRARKNAGLSEDAIQIAALALGSGVATYQDVAPAAYLVSAMNIPGLFAAPLGQALHLAKPPGVRGVLEWSNWDPSQNIILGNSAHIGDPAQGFADSITGQFPYKLAAAIQL